MDEKQLEKMNKTKLIEIIRQYEEKIRVMEECSTLLRVDTMR